MTHHKAKASEKTSEPALMSVPNDEIIARQPPRS